MRVAVLGAGFMGGVHVAAWQAVSDATVTNVYAPSPTRATPLAASIGARWTTDLAALLSDPAVDVVDICLPTPEHVPVALAALAAGKHVLVEKPIALSDEAAASLEVAAETGPIMMVAQVLRFWPEYVEAHRLVTTGAIGAPRSALATRRQAAPAWSSLFTRPDITGGAVVDMLVHDIDVLNWMFGHPIGVTGRGRPNAETGGIDQVQLLIDYAGGASALVDGGMEMPASYPFGSGLEILGEAGAVAYHFQAGGRSFAEGAGVSQLTLFPATGDATVPTVAPEDPFEAEIAYFAGCIRSGKRPARITAGDARRALRVALAARASILAGGARITLEA